MLVEVMFICLPSTWIVAADSHTFRDQYWGASLDKHVYASRTVTGPHCPKCSMCWVVQRHVFYWGGFQLLHTNSARVHIAPRAPAKDHSAQISVFRLHAVLQRVCGHEKRCCTELCHAPASLHVFGSAALSAGLCGLWTHTEHTRNTSSKYAVSIHRYYWLPYMAFHFAYTYGLQFCLCCLYLCFLMWGR